MSSRCGALSRAVVAAFHIIITVGAVSGCTGGSPTEPASDGGSSSSPDVLGMTLSAVDGQPIGGVTVRIGSKTAVSAADGSFQMQQVASGPQAAILSGTSIVERRTTVTALPAETMRETLIPLTFDLTAFDQMFRGSNDRLQRWTATPSLVVVTTVMNYTAGFGDQDNYYATSEQLTEDETTLLIDQLTEALAMLTGNTFASFASIERESASSGSKVNTLRIGKIVVGRYNGIQGLLSTIGFGRWATEASGEVVGGAVYLDRDYDKSNDARRLLRTHELGHALGYNHVTARVSIMNPAVGPEPTVFDRQGAIIAFLRPPGNQSPDTDPGSGSSAGGLRVARIPSTVVWSTPTICAP
jgi:hypothetical protein